MLVLSEVYEQVYPITVKFLGNEIKGTAKLFGSARMMLKELQDDVDKLQAEAEAINEKDKQSVKKRNALLDQATETMTSLNLHMLARHYVSLDVSLSANGEAVPITVENLKHFPDALTIAMTEALNEAREQQKKMTQGE